MSVLFHVRLCYCLYLRMSLSMYLCLSVLIHMCSVCLSLSVWVSLCVYVCVSLSMCVCLCLSLSVCPCLCVCVSVYPCLCVCVSVCGMIIPASGTSILSSSTCQCPRAVLQPWEESISTALPSPWSVERQNPHPPVFSKRQQGLLCAASPSPCTPGQPCCCPRDDILLHQNFWPLHPPRMDPSSLTLAAINPQSKCHMWDPTAWSYECPSCPTEPMGDQCWGELPMLPGSSLWCVLAGSISLLSGRQGFGSHGLPVPRAPRCYDPLWGTWWECAAE